jgi:hypothetical protein
LAPTLSIKRERSQPTFSPEYHSQILITMQNENPQNPQMWREYRRIKRRLLILIFGWIPTVLVIAVISHLIGELQKPLLILGTS